LQKTNAFLDLQVGSCVGRILLNIFCLCPTSMAQLSSMAETHKKTIRPKHNKKGDCPAVNSKHTNFSAQNFM
jgi:hypothetical protein